MTSQGAAATTRRKTVISILAFSWIIGVLHNCAEDSSPKLSPQSPLEEHRRWSLKVGDEFTLSLNDQQALDQFGYDVAGESGGQPRPAGGVYPTIQSRCRPGAVLRARNPRIRTIRCKQRSDFDVYWTRLNVYIALQELEPDRFRLLWTTAWSIKYPSTVKVFDLNADGIPDYRVETEGAMSHATLSYMLTHPETLVPREVFETKIASPPNNSCAGFERKIRLGVRDSSRMPELLVSIVPLYDFDNPECVRASHGDWEAEIRLAMQKSGGVNRYRFDGTSYKIYGEAIDPETWAGP